MGCSIGKRASEGATESQNGFYLEVPYKQWQQQNRQRQYTVPEKVLARIVGKLELPTPDEALHVSYFINGRFQSL